MGKSLGNFITLREFFKGSHKSLLQAYDPMTIRFFILQAHYRSTLDFSNEALQAAEKGLQRLLQAMATLDEITPSTTSSVDVSLLENKCYEAMNDDFNAPVAIAHLFDSVRIINSVKDKKESLSTDDLESLRSTFKTFVTDIFGLSGEINRQGEESGQIISGLMELLLELRQQARKQKDWATSDKIRDALNEMKISVKDGAEGSSWSISGKN